MPNVDRSLLHSIFPIHRRARLAVSGEGVKLFATFYPPTLSAQHAAFSYHTVGGQHYIYHRVPSHRRTDWCCHPRQLVSCHSIPMRPIGDSSVRKYTQARTVATLLHRNYTFSDAMTQYRYSLPADSMRSLPIDSCAIVVDWVARIKQRLLFV